MRDVLKFSEMIELDDYDTTATVRYICKNIMILGISVSIYQRIKNAQKFK